MDEKRIEQKLDEISDRMEAKMKAMEDKFDRKFEEPTGDVRPCRPGWKSSRPSGFCGIIMIAAGIIFLLDNIHWIHWDLPMIPVFMVILGAYLIYRSRRD